MTIYTGATASPWSRPLPGLLLLGLLGSSGCVLTEERSCERDGKRYEVGEHFASDCNTCTCMEGGEIACTLKGCIDADAGRDGGADPKRDGGPDGGQPQCEFEGKLYVAGEAMPMDDACHRGCGCSSSGEIVCTAIECRETCDFEGTTYDRGDRFHDALRCNTCRCTAAGGENVVACTARACDPAGACTIGDTKIADGNSIVCADGCNTCLCNDGSWSSTDAACAPPPKVEPCGDRLRDRVDFEVMYRSADALAVEIDRVGCLNEAEPPFTLCWNERFEESAPVQTWLHLVGAGTQGCSSLEGGQQKVFDLTPLREAYERAYQSQHGTVEVHTQAVGEKSIRYEF